MRSRDICMHARVQLGPPFKREPRYLHALMLEPAQGRSRESLDACMHTYSILMLQTVLQLMCAQEISACMHVYSLGRHWSALSLQYWTVSQKTISMGSDLELT